MSLTQRLLSPVADVRREESTTALLMFMASFCAIAGYSVIKPITRSAFIKDLGADNLPWMPLATAFVIAGLMGGYAWLMQRLPRRWGIPMTQAAMAVLLVGFWFLFRLEGWWVAALFYVWGLLMGILLTSQFWTLANVIYDARQAKRLFGLIGAGAPLGGAAAGWLGTQAEAIGTYNLLLYSAAIMVGSAVAVSMVLAREHATVDVAGAAAASEKGVGAGEALRLLRSSRHLQIIALVIMFAAVGAQVIEQQLNMAAEAAEGQSNVDAITEFLARVLLWMSLAAFVIQAFLTSRIHRFLGIGFALFILPVSLGSTAFLMLLSGALWTPQIARVLDQSLRYTVDKTTREILFLPLPTELKLQAKPFVDVTVDRLGKGVSSLLLLVLVQDWGLGLDWRQISYASLAITGLWFFAAVAAKRGYLTAFRRSIERREVDTNTSRLPVADLSTVETLVEELAHPDEARVLYAIDVLESLEKRNLISPLLFRHESPAVRARTLTAFARMSPETVQRWHPAIERMLSDRSPDVRSAAVRALAALRGARAVDLARPLLTDPDQRLAVTAAVVLANSEDAHDRRAAEATLAAVVADTSDSAAPLRRDVAAALGRIEHAEFRQLLVPLVYDSEPGVAEEAMRAIRSLGTSEFIYVPTLVSLLRNRRLKAAAREVLVSYGEPVLEPLAHFLRDEGEDIWVRRHLPATIARIGSQQAVNVLVGALSDPDGFIRYKAVEALEYLRHGSAALQFPREPIEAQLLKEARAFFTTLTLRHNLFVRGNAPSDALLNRALEEKSQRAVDRIYRLLALIHPWKDVDAVRWSLEHGDARARAAGSEYLDNVLTGTIRRQIVPILEALPLEEKVRRGHVLVRSRPRDVEESLLHLINDDDAIVSACAIDLVRELKEWRLKDDIEHVLAHRDVQDWYVFEAASWTLAAHRLGDQRRRELWREPLPATELAARLRLLPLFSAVGVDELFRLASAGRQQRYEGGTVLLQEGHAPETAYVLLDGRVAVRRQGTPATAIEAPGAIGLRETLEGHASGATVRADGPVVALALPVDDLRTLISDSPELLDGLLRTFVPQDVAGEERRTVVRSGVAADLLALAAESVSPIDKLLLLQRLPLFAGVPADEMLHVGSIARDIRIGSGDQVAAEGTAPAIYYVLVGELSVESAVHEAAAGGGGELKVAGPGDAIGIFETLAGRRLGRALHGQRNGHALQINRGDLIDLLAQRPGLAQHVFAALFEMLEHPLPA
jgi:ATP/ADP translocase/HEAT repeat protein/CRP-like cAMP-binding protein